MSIFNEEDNNCNCPKCNSSNTIHGAFLLGCLDCGWSHHNKYPCTVCGKPSNSSCSDGENGNQIYHGCSEHSARLYFNQRCQQLKAERK